MKRTLALTTALLALAATAPGAGAYTLVLDMDSATAGIQSSVSVVAGSTVTVTGHLTSVSGAAIFNDLGFDLSWSKPGEAASLALLGGAAMAGSLAGISPSVDFFSAGVVTPGTALTASGLGAIGTNTFNIGGFGYLDAAFSGYASFGLPFAPPGTTVDVFTADFLVTGAVGSSVSVDPSGIFVPGLYTTPPPIMIGGDALWDPIITLSTFSGAFTGGLVTVVPEPRRGLLALAALLALATAALSSEPRRRVRISRPSPNRTARPRHPSR